MPGVFLSYPAYVEEFFTPEELNNFDEMEIRLRVVAEHMM
jgi:hypothetical protein